MGLSVLPASPPTRPESLWHLAFVSRPGFGVHYSRLAKDGSGGLRPAGSSTALLPQGYRVMGAFRPRISPSGRFSAVPCWGAVEAIAIFDNHRRKLKGLARSSGAYDFSWSPDERHLAVYGYPRGESVPLSLWTLGRDLPQRTGEWVRGAFWGGGALYVRTADGRWLRFARTSAGWTKKASSGAELQRNSPETFGRLGPKRMLGIDFIGSPAVHGTRGVFLPEAEDVGIRALGKKEFWGTGRRIEAFRDVLLGGRWSPLPPRLRPQTFPKVTWQQDGRLLQYAPGALYYQMKPETSEKATGFLYTIVPGRQRTKLAVSPLTGVEDGYIYSVRS